MKVVHFSTGVNHFSANTRLHEALKHADVESTIVVKGFEKGIKHVQCTRPSLWYKLKAKIYNKISYLVMDKYNKPEGMPFSINWMGEDVTRISEVMEADIIHIHWICGLLSPYNIKQLIETGKIIVWTCHDSWPFTGGCHVRYGCQKFEEECGSCPIINSNKENDISKKVMKYKRKYLGDKKIAFIAPSNWMQKNIMTSSLFKDCVCKVIPNTIETNIFKDKTQKEIQQVLNYKKDKQKIHLLFGAVSIDIPYKGLNYLLNMLTKIKEEYPDLAQKIVLHIVGAEQSSIDILAKYECNFWGFINQQERMACIYSLADILVYPSIDDNLPNMVLESLACATPVVSFNTGGISDMIEHKKNGYLASYKDENDLLQGLLWVLENNLNNCLGQYAREKIRREFNEEYIADLHIEFYRSLLEENIDVQN